MRRNVVLVILWAVVWVGLSATSQGEFQCTVTQADAAFTSLTCLFPHDGNLPVRTIDFSGDWPPTAEIDGSATCHIWHGWNRGETACVAGLSPQAICNFAAEHFRFELRINGAPVSPTYVTVGFEEAVGVNGRDVLGPVETYYEFPAGYFSPGVYVLEATWRIVDLSCECTDGCDESDQPGGSATFPPRSITVTVVY